MASINVTGGIRGDGGVSVNGDFIGSFDRLIKEMPELCNSALNVGAYIIKDSIKSVFASRMPAANRAFKVPATSQGGYKITKPDRLVDAVMQSKAKIDHVTISVRGNAPGSPLFIARMYDHGTKDRYVRTYKGKKLKTRRYVGSIDGVNYFNPGISQGEEPAYNAMQSVFEKHIERNLQ